MNHYRQRDEEKPDKNERGKKDHALTISEEAEKVKPTDSEAEPLQAIVFPLPSLLFSVADKALRLYQAALMDQARRSLRPCARTRGGRRRAKFRRAQCKRGARGRHRPTESHLFQDREI